MSTDSHAPVAIVTGSATGVGRACAVRLAQLGYAITVNYSKSKAEAEETAELVRHVGVPVKLVQANVADESAVKAMVADTVQDFGGLDVLVNNAATTKFISHDDLDALTDDVWDEIFAVNVKGVLYASRAAMPHLKARKGSIVSISSVAGQTGQGSSIPYCATKGAVNTMTRSLARAFAPEVRVNAVAPGPILTRWMDGREEYVNKYLEQVPLKRAATPDDIADAVVFLATGTSLTTGQILVIDGGRTV